MCREEAGPGMEQAERLMGKVSGALLRTRASCFHTGQGASSTRCLTRMHAHAHHYCCVENRTAELLKRHDECSSGVVVRKRRKKNLVSFSTMFDVRAYEHRQ